VARVESLAGCSRWLGDCVLCMAAVSLFVFVRRSSRVERPPVRSLCVYEWADHFCPRFPRFAHPCGRPVKGDVEGRYQKG
jgi:hypothetical protein